MEVDTSTNAPLYSIGEVAERANVSRRTVRYYVQRGLIDAPLGRGRGSAYTQKHVEQIQRVLRLQREGVTLEAIEQLPANADAQESARVPLAAEVVVRIPLRPGLNLEVQSGAHIPPPAVLEQLAAACERILNTHSETENLDDAAGANGASNEEERTQ